MTPAATRKTLKIASRSAARTSSMSAPWVESMSEPRTARKRCTGTATETIDYTHSATQIVILAGNLSNSITLTGVQDTVYDPGETVIVDITGVTNGVESGNQQVTATITDDDSQPSGTLGLSGSPFAENAGTATITATLSNLSNEAVTVTLDFTGTATDVTDYSHPSSSIVISTETGRARPSSGLS